MKTLTLLNPWATLLVAGIKTIETRSWRTNYRGWLAIHSSAKTKTKLQDLSLFGEFTFDYTKILDLCKFNGFIIASCKLVDVVPAESIRDSLSSFERYAGNYKDGRFAWVLENIQRLPVPIPAKGRLGLWESPRCHSDNDGDCDWPECPQKKEHRSYCPLAKLDELDPSWNGE